MKMLEINKFLIFENQEDWDNNTCAEDKKRIVGKPARYTRTPTKFPSLYRNHGTWSVFEYDAYFEEEFTKENFTENTLLELEKKYQKNYEEAVQNLKAVKHIKEIFNKSKEL